MRLKVYLTGERVLDEAGRVELRRGPLFCEIEFVGDGTPGEITYHPVEPTKRAYTEERLATKRKALEDLLKSPARVLDGGGSVGDGDSVLFYDHAKLVHPWTPEHMGSVVMEYLSGSCKFELVDFPSRNPQRDT